MNKKELKKENKNVSPAPVEIIRATQVVLHLYAQTFSQLASYDRGERIYN